ncbi:hypothetical protein PPYR_09862 [Photinus pyralis]|uniref:Carboxylic ester hydrolase n=1 Tax=Photinus pyralis TaxID=7054 RepID=A0A5N4AES1_PHOPY|nr:venom carboxylesterase-6-like [Photinus pyralis]KAB0795801.1 hypothetical protein PPYR_09862 [Photinus pyralis]
MQLILTLFYITYSLAYEPPAPVVHTSLGNIRGYHTFSLEGRRFSAFEGIPYAQPPIGHLRFEAPRSALPWNRTLEAHNLFVCSQFQNMAFEAVDAENVFDRKKDQEDCLYLNVYVPKEQPSENDNYDVVVNIHGGAFMNGDPNLVTPGIIMDRDFIYINLNYRLGILGFLSTEDTVVPGNNGLKDQQLALRWVHTHIKHFGGNPNAITLMGGSAGGASVHFHYFSPKSRGLFHRGISQSGSVLLPWAIQVGALKKAQKLAGLLNCKNSNTRDMVYCLKQIPVHELISKLSHFYHSTMYPLAPFAPVVEVESDSSFITKHPYQQLLNGDVYDVPWLTWRAADEGIFLGVLIPPGPHDEIEKNWDEWSPFMFNYDYTVAESQKKAVARKIKSFYMKNEKLSHNNIRKFIKLMGDRYFNVGYERAITMQANLGKSPVYAGIYNFNKTHGLAKAFGVDIEGVTHGDESFLLHHQVPVKDIKLSKPEKDMKNMLLDILASYAKHGKPEAPGISWEPVTPGKFNYLFMCDAHDSKMVENPDVDAQEFWESLDIKEYGPTFSPKKKSGANSYYLNLNLPLVTLCLFVMMFQ